MQMRLAQIANAIGADLPEGLDGDTAVTGVSTDTRTLGQGDIYVALTGERFDGHDYVDKALNGGAVAAVVASPPPGLGDERLLIVPEPLTALGKIAGAWRGTFAIPVVAVTGSVGKTTTKDMIACALGPLGIVVKTQKNENNEIGLPKTLLRLDDSSAAAVVEMGMRGAGQIAYLAEIARPTVGIITLIGESHIELLGSRDAIAAAKSELFRALGATGGIAVYNAADEYADTLRQAAGKKVVTFADGSGRIAPSSNFRLMDAVRDGQGWTGHAIGPANMRLTLRVMSCSRHDLVNALGAVAVAYASGVPASEAAARIESYRPGSMRMEILHGRDGATIISDCYNAAPTSMKAALETLALTEAVGRRIAFLGDMKELGDHAAAMHADVVRAASDLGLSEIYVVGELFAAVASGGRRRFETSVEAAQYAREELGVGKGDIVLVKGSRSMTMELVVDALKETGTAVSI